MPSNNTFVIIKSKSHEDGEEEEVFDQSKDTILDAKIKDLKCKNKVKSLIILEASMERLKQPLWRWLLVGSKHGFAYFMKVGLNGTWTNPHRLKVERDVPQEKLVETFGKATPHLGFQYMEC
jgi:hypothetical protein